LWTLHGLRGLAEHDIEEALKDRTAGVREQALRLAEERLRDSPRLRSAVASLADDPSPRVRFQLAFALGASDAAEMTAALVKVARTDAADPWTQMAVLSSMRGSGLDLLEALVKDRTFRTETTASRLQLLNRLAALVGAKADEAELGRALGVLGESAGEFAPWQFAALDGLGQGLQNSSRPLARLWEQPPPALKDAVARVRPLFERASDMGRDAKRSAAERAAAVRLLGRGPYALAASSAPDLLHAQTPPEVQLAMVRALSAHARSEVADLLLTSWNGYGPSVRREVVEALFARPQRLPALLAALEDKKVLANQLEPLRIEQLRKLRDAKLRDRVIRALAGQLTSDRRKVVAAYSAALELRSEAAQGKAVFKKNCSVCHRLENEGFEVGPDLLSALRNKSAEQLLDDILDPSKEVDPRYLNYQITTKKGQTFSGLIAADTAASVTLRRGEKAEDTILRDQIDDIQATGKSVMPEGLEMQLSKQDVADLIAYLRAVASTK
jgi:putative heme-binding domain-containing protein